MWTMNARVDDDPELERTRRELAMVRRQLELTLDVAGAPCAWEWDIRRARLVADVRFAAITQQDPVALADGVSTDQFFKSIHPDDLKRVKLAVAGMLAGSEVFSKEYRLLKSDGGYRWVHAKGRGIFDEDDEPASFVGILIDITDQKRITEELRVAQSAGGIGTFEHKIGWATVNVSEQFCRLFGLHPSRVIPVIILNDLIHPDDERIIDLRDPDGRQEERSIEFRIRRADDGQERWLARRGEYVVDSESSGHRYVGVIFDVTEARQAQDNLKKANEELAGIAREREQFIAVLGHDLRNPLASMSAGLRIITKDVNDRQSTRVLRLMGESVQRMGSLIENLLDLARGRLGNGIGLEITRGGRIEPMLAKIVNEIQAAHPERIIQTEFNLHRPINVDQARLEQLLSNLLGNAITHGAAEEPVTVSARVLENEFQLTVGNGGEPIPEAVMQRLFQPFYRGEDNIHKQGLGLGLYIASEIAKAHGGVLQASSDTGRTCFTFSIPLDTTEVVVL
ncbi:PAS domain-containing protein [Rhizobium sp. VS19-DR104.2]|uniref:sensor histidine kinase n=1 Tax=unclassified Rhizobium TaxID=2613769 RepID=UPI001C5B34B8|nr:MULTISPECIES: PAS domain-containing sensor histidine kinase [unclassified Rhizobium]MBZ5763078.1 PAS domain-containing protein [Rhizobium sp. VS19-DR96]MBZ5768954.1 PAS domain-containing protein [Rhizobium sp. VS19-DR129.2]MBZ5776572.1 PAS domain-containing protein [Rhizobium sp. VS19-DRK62.2]MBZ5787689.1 PAS domain-containing protein [Rhizobium sp. VS19-DR121]MBZ5805062.1 PAS domain-containing protein [Rhizobium sp. VS19-DR181]